MTSTETLKKIYVLFSTSQMGEFEEGAVVEPFLCLAISETNDLIYRILTDTIVYVDPYPGGTIPNHTTRRGARTDLNIELPEGTLVAIVAGIRATGVTWEQTATFAISGGLYLE